MSQDKNTLNMSDVNTVVRIFIQNKENYYLGILGKVESAGIHDDIPLQILIYRGGVVLEQLRIVDDIDQECDNMIVSVVFNFDEVPIKWPLERHVDYTENLHLKQYENYVDLDKFKKFIEMFVKKDNKCIN